MAKVASTPGKTRSRKKPAAKRRPKATRRRRLGTAKKDATPEPAHSATVGRLERTRRLLLAALRVWELKRRLRD